MPFNSFQFGLFFVVLYVCYLLSRHKWQNRLLLYGSYFFYAAWDYRFLALIWISTVINYVAALQISKNSKNVHAKRNWLWISIVCNLGILCFFKYFNFFIGSLTDLLSFFGGSSIELSLHIVLPVGISFYTFQTMSYMIDVYREILEPTTCLPDFALYVAFFPQLVAGPIERATRLLPQIQQSRSINHEHITTGFYLILFGLFEKVVVADNLAVIVDHIYDGKPTQGIDVLLATYCFALQILADFDGYSNIAKGLASLMGFQLMTNFNAPYFSETPSEFWSRWHISLSTWLRDYLYIPLGGNRFGRLKTMRNLTITMLLGGLWHGASWMFVLWGAYHGILLVIYHSLERTVLAIPPFFRKILLFHLVCAGWIFFRAQNTSQLYYLLSTLFTEFHLIFQPETIVIVQKLLLYSSLLILYHYAQFRTGKRYPLYDLPIIPRVLSYTVMTYMIIIFGYNNSQSFIYFQF